AANRVHKAEDELAGLRDLGRLPGERLPYLLDVGEEATDSVLTRVHLGIEDAVGHVEAEIRRAQGQQGSQVARVERVVGTSNNVGPRGPRSARPRVPTGHEPGTRPSR